MTDYPPSLTLIGFAPTKQDIDLAVATLAQAASAQSLPTRAFLYAIEKVAVPSPIKNRSLPGLEPDALVQLHNSGLAGDRAQCLAYFRSGFLALGLRHALAGCRPGTIAAWPSTPAAFLGGRLEAPVDGDQLWRTGSASREWQVLRIDDPARVTTALTFVVNAYLKGTAWRLLDWDINRVFATALAAALVA